MAKPKLKTYTVTQVAEAMFTVKVTAKNAAGANDKAMARIEERCNALSRKYRSVAFGGISDDFLPAWDEDEYGSI